jgi:hypothetical protein
MTLNLALLTSPASTRALGFQACDLAADGLDGSEAKPQADAGPTVIGPVVIGVVIPVAIVGSVIWSVIAIPSMIVGPIVAIPTVPIPHFLHLASSLTLRQRQNPRFSGSGFRRGDH